MSDGGASQLTERERCLDRASEIVMLRGAHYRPPGEFFAKLAKRWSATLGVEISARQVVLCLIELKLERALAGPHPDTVVDIAGYAACLAEVDESSGASGPPPAGSALERSPHWPRVLAFAVEMDTKLKENLHKGDWREASATLRRDAGVLLTRLRDEVAELVQKLPEGGPYDHRAVTREASDVANFAMMIADLFGVTLDAP